MTELGISLLGYGLSGRFFHAPLIDAVPGLRLINVMTSQADAVLQAYPFAAVLTDPHDAIKDPKVQIVVVATPNEMHEPLARAALEAGKHVVVDKPMTTDVAKADSLIRVANERGCLLVPYHNRRWDADYRTLCKCLDGGLLGEMRTWESHYDRYRPTIKDNWRERPAAGSGLLYDIAPHLIDQVLARYGLPDWVAADVQTQRPDAHVDDYFHLILAWGPMRAILHAGTLVCGTGPRFAVHGTEGSFVKYGLDAQENALLAGHRPEEADFGVESESQRALVTTALSGIDISGYVSSERGAYLRFYELLRDAITLGGPSPIPAEAGRDVIRVIEAALLSTQTTTQFAP